MTEQYVAAINKETVGTVEKTCEAAQTHTREGQILENAAALEGKPITSLTDDSTLRKASGLLQSHADKLTAEAQRANPVVTAASANENLLNALTNPLGTDQQIAGAAIAVIQVGHQAQKEDPVVGILKDSKAALQEALKKGKFTANDVPDTLREFASNLNDAGKELKTQCVSGLEAKKSGQSKER